MAILSYITLHVGDVAAVRDWYVETIALRVVYEFEDRLAILAGEGGCQLGLEKGPPVSEPERIDLLFQVSDVDEVHGRLCEKGVEFWRGPTDEPYGQRNAILFDPVGHKVELFTYLTKEPRGG